MFFSIENKYKLDTDILKIKVAAKAKQFIFLFSFGENEIELDKYLVSTYNIKLRTACLQILLYGKFMTNNQGELLFVLTDKYWAKLANIITFGVDGLCGSNILKAALKN